MLLLKPLSVTHHFQILFQHSLFLKSFFNIFDFCLLCFNLTNFFTQSDRHLLKPLLQPHFEYRLDKELHITQQQAPHANRSNEHYCRRWVSIKTIQDLEKSTNKKATFHIQISSYVDQKNEYLVLSSATPDPFKKDINRSVSIGLLLSPHLKKKLNLTTK